MRRVRKAPALATEANAKTPRIVAVPKALSINVVHVSGRTALVSIDESALLGKLRRLIAQKFGFLDPHALALAVGNEVLKPFQSDHIMLSKAGVVEGAVVSVVVEPTSGLYVWATSDSYNVEVSEAKIQDKIGMELSKAQRLVLQCRTGYKVRDGASAAFGPPVRRSATAEWRLHIKSRCRDGKINFCLVDRFGLNHLEPHFSVLQEVWVGARGGWDQSSEDGLLFAGETHLALPPFSRGDTISLRLEDGMIRVTHSDGTGREQHAVATLPAEFASEVPPNLSSHVRSMLSLEEKDEKDDIFSKELPADAVWCVVHHYAHSRHDDTDDSFILERVQ